MSIAADLTMGHNTKLAINVHFVSIGTD